MYLCVPGDYLILERERDSDTCATGRARSKAAAEERDLTRTGGTHVAEV